jgi:hypothetical protein
MTEEQPGYLSYLLRLWQVPGSEGMDWRATLESAQTGERVGFEDLEVLFQFLREQAGLQSEEVMNGEL